MNITEHTAAKAVLEDTKKQLARLAPEAIVLHHRPEPTDTPAGQARAIAGALDACEEIAPNAEVLLVSNSDPVDFFAAYYAAQKYREERERRRS